MCRMFPDVQGREPWVLHGLFGWKMLVDGFVALLKDKTVFKKYLSLYVIIQTASIFVCWSF